MARKLFVAKPMKPGATITWKHYLTPTEWIERTGQIWSLAPLLGPGTKAPVWVVPEEPLPGERYPAVVVAEYAPRGWRGGWQWRPYATPEPGELFSSAVEGSPTEDLRLTALRSAYEVKRAALTETFALAA